VSLHCGTLLAIGVVFASDLWSVVRDGVVGAWGYLHGRASRDVLTKAPRFPLALATIIGTVPAACVGLLARDTVEAAFASMAATGALLMVTGLLLFASRWAPAPKASEVGPGRGALIGLAQAAALLPGISRSGATIATGLFAGLDRRAAGRFSFLLAVPAVGGAAVLEVARALGSGSAAASPAGPSLPALAVGTAVAAVSGWGALRLLLGVLDRGRLHWFAAYCLPAGALMILAGCRA